MPANAQERQGNQVGGEWERGRVGEWASGGGAGTVIPFDFGVNANCNCWQSQVRRLL